MTPNDGARGCGQKGRHPNYIIFGKITNFFYFKTKPLLNCKQPLVLLQCNHMVSNVIVYLVSVFQIFRIEKLTYNFL